MRVICIALAALLSTSIANATQYYVRSTGHDTGCDGTTPEDWDPNGDTTCALKSIQAAINKPNFCSTGSDVDIGPGQFAGQVVLPTICQCPSDANRCVISGAGDKGPNRTTASGISHVAAFLYGNPGSANRHRWITFQKMEIRNGSNGGILCANAAGAANYCSDITIDDVTFTDFALMSKTSTDASIGFYSSQNCSTPPYDNILINNIYMDGDETICWNAAASTSGHRVCGSRTNAMFTTACGVRISNFIVKDFEGYLTRFGHFGILEKGNVEHVWGDLDDGVIQIYNRRKVIIREVVFNHVNPINNTFSVFKIRKTPPGEGNGSTPGVVAYNNTFIAEPARCTGPTSNCPPNSLGTATSLRWRAGYSQTPTGSGGPVVGPYDEFVSVRNIYVGYGGPAGSPAIEVQSGGNPSACPTTFILDGDVFWNNAANILTSCPGTVETPEVADPQLDTNGWPSDPNNTVCTAQGPGYTAWDGGTTLPWVGAALGVCGSQMVPPPVTPPDTMCSDTEALLQKWCRPL